MPAPVREVAIRRADGLGRIHRSTIHPNAPKRYVGQPACHQTLPGLVRVPPGTVFGPDDDCHACWGADPTRLHAALNPTKET